MRLLLYGDLHAANIYSFNVKLTNHFISEYSRIDELYSTLIWIAKTTKEMNVMMPINLGDTFHQALRFYVERYNTVYRGVNNIITASQSKSGVIHKGNHDETDEVSAIETFEGAPGAILVNSSIKVKYFSEINSHFVFVPYIRNVGKTKEAFQSLYEKFKGSHSKVYVFCHLDTKEVYEGLVSSTYQLGQFNSYNDLHLEIYEAIFSGHIHFRKKINNNLYYVGACLNHNFSDSLNRKGITIVDVDPDGYKISFVENPYCPMFARFNLEKIEDAKKKIKKIEEEIAKYKNTNVYARIFSLNNDSGRKKSEEFIRDYGHLFTAYETKSLDSEDEFATIDAITVKMDHVNVFDLIVEHGTKILASQGKTKEEIEAYILRLRKICLLN